MRKIKTKPYIKVLGLGLLVYSLLPFNLLAQDISEPIPIEINDERIAEAQRRVDVAYAEVQKIRRELLDIVDSAIREMNKRGWNWNNNTKYLQYGNEIGWASVERIYRIEDRIEYKVDTDSELIERLHNFTNMRHLNAMNTPRLPVDVATFFEEILDKIESLYERSEDVLAIYEKAKDDFYALLRE